MNTYDLLVIGSGPAGQRAAISGVKKGKRVALAEARSVVGGVCTNTGTIPSKTLREAVLHFFRVQVSLDLWTELSREGERYHVRLDSSRKPCD
jgi:pyruvate/2-oxoglutarate dehydrogenase complex dihydrolipoamide dehydrogenase (E3) component